MKFVNYFVRTKGDITSRFPHITKGTGWIINQPYTIEHCHLQIKWLRDLVHEGQKIYLTTEFEIVREELEVIIVEIVLP